ncbi:MAG: single-stranded DNA-binding protein, partial [Atopobiaceae bacterium]|nr:single-stranded DNA-binding protein [Atopobiaceae bacterium]
MAVNIIALTGNLVRDPDVKAMTSGNVIMNFSLAVNERVRNSQGEYEDYASYVDCVMFGNRAEA